MGNCTPRGEDIRQSKLTEREVLEIRRDYAFGDTSSSNRKLAEKYSVTTMTIHKIVTNKTWRHLKHRTPVYKVCSKCKIEKPTHEFRKCSQCINCLRICENHPEMQAAQKIWEQRPESSGRRKRWQVTYRKANPIKCRAWNLVYRAIRRGDLHRQPCEVCGSKERIHAHHDDYSKPLIVRWLCRKHHMMHHKSLKSDN